MRIASVETVGPDRAIAAGLAHVMHHDKILMICKKAGKGPHAGRGDHPVVGDFSRRA